MTGRSSSAPPASASRLFHRLAARRIYRRIRPRRLRPLDTWKDWLAYHLLEQYAGVLPKAFAEERFAFFGQTLSGTPQQRPRWQRGVSVVNGVLGDAVGQIYAKRYFSPEAKARAAAMVANIIECLPQAHRRTGLDGPGHQSRSQDQARTHSMLAWAIRRAGAIIRRWRSSPMTSSAISGGASRFDYHRDVARLGGPVDSKNGRMTPQTVNAVNLPLQNALNFPAAILQPPFFDPEAPAAANYGAIGSIIGHEISHTFDTEGSAFDSTGALRNWWTPEDLAHFDVVTTKARRTI